MKFRLSNNESSIKIEKVSTFKKYRKVYEILKKCIES